MDRSTENRTTVFVYGTLMSGERRHAALSGQQFVSDAKTDHRYRLLLIDDYPGLVHASDRKGNSITGELWSVDQSCLSRLDAIECVDDGLYERREILLVDSIEHAEAWFYAQDVVGLKDLGSDWRSR
jgi:gamma-glutamylaminecyclotransferase